ncbi:MAG TPA: SpoVG family protein [Pirellulales bacterium]|nr:SpoVG family protein [Pirellulales bacterium]
MEITEVRIKLMDEVAGERLHAFCSITLDDCFVIRDLKIIEGTNGPFVAMPSRKLTSHCSQCGYKNHLRAQYCNQCGLRQKEDRAAKDEDGRAKLYADIAHPINSRCREMIQEKVITSYQEELKAAQLPGYVSSYDDFDEEYSRPPAKHNLFHPREPRGEPHARPKHVEHTKVERARPEPVRNEQTKVEPAVHEPRGPHKAPAQQHVNRPATEDPTPGGFGAGIF